MAKKQEFSQKKIPWLTSVISLGLSAIFLTLFYGFPESGGAWIHLIERKILDANFRNVTRIIKPDPSIAIIVINDAALKAMEPTYGRWPWPRRAMGEIVEYLHHIGVRAVGIDILYPENNRNDPEGDRFFAEQVKAAGNVILAADFPTKGDPLLPFDPLDKAAADLGGIDFTADPDGPTRRYRLLYPRPDRTHHGLALAVINHLHIPVAWNQIALQQNGYWLNWYGPQGQFTYLEASKILQARQEWKRGSALPDGLHQQAAQLLKDKIVFIGVTATGLFDLRASPFSPIYPGIEIHATAASNLIQGDYLHPLSPGWGFAYILALALLTAVVGSLLNSPTTELLFALGVILLATIVGTWSFAKGVWIPTGFPIIIILLTAIITQFLHYLTTGKEKRFIKHAFSRYINEEVLDELLDHPEKLELGGENRVLTVLFSDIRNFTGLSEQLPPNEVVALLNEYLTEMVDIVFTHHGTLDKFIGDAVMAFWGAPVKTDDHAEQAVQAALAMLKKVEELRARWQEQGKPALHIGIGINTAEITVGNIGSERSQSYTVIGDGVNLASRLESLNKTYQTSLIVSEATYERVKDQVTARFLDDVKVKGKEQSVKIYEIS